MIRGMAHATARSAYARLTDRLNRFPQGAPPSELLYRILAVLFTPREAELVAQLPIRPFTVARAADTWKVTAAEAQSTLETLASRGCSWTWSTAGRRPTCCPRRWRASSSSR